MASTRHNAEFANQFFPNDPLDTAIEWIKANPVWLPHLI